MGWRLRLARALLVLLGVGMGLGGAPGQAAEPRRLVLGYDQPAETGYGIFAELFAAELARLSDGSLVVDGVPGARLGNEPQMLEKVGAGTIDFAIAATANAAPLRPAAAVLSFHYLFRSEAELAKAIGDPRLRLAVQQLFDGHPEGTRVLALLTSGLRDLYGKREARRVEDLDAVKIRVQAAASEDLFFPAYGAHTVHLAFGDVYSALQAGLAEMAENSLGVYLANRHYEVAPVVSLTQHEAGIAALWGSERLWRSLDTIQRGWVAAAAEEAGRREPAQAFALEHAARAQLERMGVRFVVPVEKAGFRRLAEPLQDEAARGLGPDAVRLLALCRSLR